MADYAAEHACLSRGCTDGSGSEWIVSYPTEEPTAIGHNAMLCAGGVSVTNAGLQAISLCALRFDKKPHLTKATIVVH
jgi:hypothetical protein